MAFRELAHGAADQRPRVVHVSRRRHGLRDGWAIHNAIMRRPADVTVAIDGVSMSIASLIAMAGDQIQMTDNAMLMIHAPGP